MLLGRSCARSGSEKAGEGKNLPSYLIEGDGPASVTGRRKFLGQSGKGLRANMSLDNCLKRTSNLRARNHLRRALVGAAIVPMLAALAPRAATAATKYWDINGATAGAGGATPTG